MLVVALSGIGAARVPGAGMCIPLLMQCGSGQPSPAPSQGPRPSPAPVAPLPGKIGLPPAPGSGTPPAPAIGVPDDGAPTFTLPAAQLGGSSISISGLHSVTVVTVPLANGTRTTALKIVADGVTVKDFLLDVRKATGPALVTDATTMQLTGNVQVYLDSLTASLLDGTALTLLANTPPPGDELPPTMLRVTLGLVGVTANSIAFSAPHQSLN
ncbi:hypothetical protein [Glaciihabitans sp. INWT7]|uniref:hypothetical protein n=1 Tax=Glaciihabitans sp. INWT7 TaxID=2596912 RepID=UPI0021065A94|nr:hypothetical protein [Glaciihabitans sp. INWT7]